MVAATRKAGVYLKDAGGLPPIRNRYEAAIPGTADRPWIPAFVRDARFDANSFTRWELARKARYERANNWLLASLEDKDVKYTVGPFGHIVKPASSDSEWNKYMTDAYLAWCESPFLDSDLPMSQGHRLARKEMHVDGEVFEVLTYRKFLGSQSTPAVELIESHRVSCPGQEYDYPTVGDGIVDGVEMMRDETGQLIGRPRGFHVRSGLDGTQWAFRPAYNPRQPGAGGMLHIGDPDRIGMARYITKYAPILNEIADLSLLWMLEMDRAKSNSEVAAIWNTFSGESPTSTFSNMGSIPDSVLPGVPNVPGSYNDKQIAEKIAQFRKVISARVVPLKVGESMSIHDNPNPSAAQQWLWKFVIERCCVTRGIPLVLILPESMQGTIARAVLDDAQLGFTAQFAINARAAVQKYRFFADWARYNLPKLADAPADWQQARVVPPPQINVDFGRNMTAMIAGIEAGIYSYEDVVGKDGSTAEDRFLQKARQIGRAKQIAAQVSAEMGVEVKPEEILGNLQKLMTLQNQAETDETQPPKGGKVNNPQLVED